jgi:hypothetical protein
LKISRSKHGTDTLLFMRSKTTGVPDSTMI